MRKQIIEDAAHGVATQVRAVEDAIDSTLAKIAEHHGELVVARGKIPGLRTVAVGDEPCSSTTSPGRSSRGRLSLVH